MCVLRHPQTLGGVDLSPCYSRTSVARVLTSQDHRIESAMAQQQSSPQALPTEEDHHVVQFPTRQAAYTPTEPAGRSAVRPAVRSQVRVRSYVIRQVVVVEVVGRLSDALVEELDLAIQTALAERSRGVVCDLSAVLEGAAPGALEVLATAGRHVRDWPGIPVAVACPDPRVREGLRAHPLGSHLIVTASLLPAMTAVLATRTLTIERLHLSPHPTAPRAARDFVTRTLLDWRLKPVIPFASLVVGELVASSSVDAGTDIDLSVAWNLGALRLTVRDHGPALRGQQSSPLDLHGRGLAVVAGLSRAFGVLPTADGGKLIWAVLDAPQPRLSTGNATRDPKREPVKGASIAKAI